MDRRAQSQTIGLITLMVLVTALVAYFCLRSTQPLQAGSIHVKDAPAVTPPPPSAVNDPQDTPAVAPAAQVSTPTPAPEASGIVVHVAGAVMRPGVYRLPSGARNQDALNAAGGPTAFANTDAVNLAAVVRDGSQIYFPTRDEQASGGAAPPASSSRRSSRQRSQPEENTPPSATGNPADTNSAPPAANDSNSQPDRPDKLTDPSQGQVNINTASSEELQRLPGIGPALADRILAYRQANGGFKTVEELREVSGIGDKKFAKLQPFIRID